MYGLTEEQMNDPGPGTRLTVVEPMNQEKPLEETEEYVQDEERGDSEGGSLLLPIAGLFVIVVCEVALFLGSLNYIHAISSPKEL